jgi:hypothetical protein
VSKNIDKIFKQIQKESEQIALNAMLQVQRDLVAKVEDEYQSCLKRYYAYKPKIYKRIGGSSMALEKAISVIPTPEDLVDKCSGFFIILKYDSKKIKGMHKSKSDYHQSGKKWISRFDSPEKFNFNRDANGIPEGNNGIPEADWILKNYMKGIHPGAPWADDTVDSENTDEHMTEFFDKTLPGMVNDLAVKAMQNAVINYITK